MIRSAIYSIKILKVIIKCRFFCAPKNRGEYLANSFEKLGPSFIKFGQALSVRSDIVGEDIANSLSRLQDKMPQFSTRVAIKTIEKELGKPLSEIFAEFDNKAVAAASIAQVHKAVTVCGKTVAVKILRPNVEKRFRHDLKLFYFLAWFAGKIPALKRLRPKAVIDVFASTVRKELDLRMEAAAASELRENTKNDEGFRAPQIFWEYTAQRVLVSEWVEGIQINDKEALLKAGHNLSEVSRNLAISFLNQAYRDGFFHADIHPGNLFVDSAGRIVPVDFGIMGRLDNETRLYVAEILRGFLTGDYMHVAQVHFDAGYVAADKSVHDFALACRAIGEPLMGLPASKVSIARLLALLFKVTEDFDMQTQPQLLLLQKTMVLIEGVGQSLDPDVNLWQMAEDWIQKWAKTNLGAEAHIKAALKNIFTALKNLPERLKQLDEMLAKMAKDKK